MKYTVLFTALLITVTGELMAQSRHTSATSMALGGGGTAYVNSYHANFVNPANLMLMNRGNNEPGFTIGLLGGLSTAAGGGLANITVYNEYFTGGQTLTSDLNRRALDTWFGASLTENKNLGAQVDVIPLGLSRRSDKWSAGLALRSRVLMGAGVNRGLMELGLYGMDSNLFSTARPINMDFDVMAFSELSAGYAMKFLELPQLFGILKNIKIYGGAAPKLLFGTNYSAMSMTSTLQITEADGFVDELRHRFTYQLETTGSVTDQLNRYYNDRQSQGNDINIADYIEPEESDFSEIKGRGFGIDLGVTAEMDIAIPIIGEFFKGDERLRVAASLTDLGSISFDTQYGLFAADGDLRWRGYNIDQDRIDNEFNGDKGDYFKYVFTDSIANEVYGNFSPQNQSSVTKGLPSMFNFGAHLTMDKLSISMDLGTGFVERGLNARRASFAAGIEYRLFNAIPLRVGTHTGGFASTTYSTGIGVSLRNFELNFGAVTAPKSEKRGTHIGAAWSGLIIRF